MPAYLSRILERTQQGRMSVPIAEARACAKSRAVACLILITGVESMRQLVSMIGLAS